MDDATRKDMFRTQMPFASLAEEEELLIKLYQQNPCLGTKETGVTKTMRSEPGCTKRSGLKWHTCSPTPPLITRGKVCVDLCFFSVNFLSPQTKIAAKTTKFVVDLGEYCWW